MAGRAQTSMQERFMEKVNKRGPYPARRELGRCWDWTACQNGWGYGAFRVGKKTLGAHVVSYRAFRYKGKRIPKGIEVDHLCSRPICVRPSHLELVTQAENVRRADNWQRKKTHCKRNHPYDEVNTYRGKNGARWCRACDRARNPRKRSRKVGT